MSVQFTFRPIDHTTWPHDGRNRYKSCPFRVSYSRTLRELSDELRRIGVAHAVAAPSAVRRLEAAAEWQ